MGVYRNIIESVKDGVESALAGTGARIYLGLRQFRTREIFNLAAEDSLATVPTVNIWFIVPGKPEEEALTLSSHLVHHPVTIAAYYQVYDPTYDPTATEVYTDMESELTLLDLAESVRDALRNAGALHGGSVADSCTVPRVTVWDIRPIDETRCHYCEMELVADKEVLVSLTTE